MRTARPGSGEVDELLNLAEDCLASGDAGRWRRASAILARQAIEEGVRVQLAEHIPPESSVSMRARIITYRTLNQDDMSPGQVAWAWSTLSDFCHHRVYDIPPPASVIQTCIDYARASLGEPG